MGLTGVKERGGGVGLEQERGLISGILLYFFSLDGELYVTRNLNPFISEKMLGCSVQTDGKLSVISGCP